MTGLLLTFFWPKLLAIIFLYLLVPFLFVVWRSPEKWWIEFSQVLLCIIIMPLGLGFFGNVDYSEFIVHQYWQPEDTYRYLKIGGYAVVFGLGGKEILKNIYKIATGKELGSEQIERAIIQKVEAIQEEAPIKMVEKNVAAELLLLFNKLNSSASKEEINNISPMAKGLLDFLEEFDGVRLERGRYYLNSVGRRVLEAKADESQ